MALIAGDGAPSLLPVLAIRADPRPAAPPSCRKSEASEVLVVMILNSLQYFVVVSRHGTTQRIRFCRGTRQPKFEKISTSKVSSCRQKQESL